jgi:parallel beta-helix repeat protein
MNKQISTTLSCLLCLLVCNGSAVALITPIVAPTNRGNWYVGGIGEGNFTLIQDAFDNASDGDTIYIFPGTYQGGLILRKALTVKGSDPASTIIDAHQAYNNLWINTTEFHLIDLGFTNASHREIYIENSTDSSLNNCRLVNGVSQAWNGLWAWNSMGLDLTTCTILNYLDGIDLVKAKHSWIVDCYLSNLQSNLITSNSWNSGAHIEDCTIIGQVSNFSNGGLYLRGESNEVLECTFENCSDAISLYQSNHTLINSCTMKNCSDSGVELSDAHDNHIFGCTFTRCKTYAIYISYDCEKIDIDVCTITDCPGGGIFMDGYDNTLTRSTITHSGYGNNRAGIYSRYRNTIYHNNFIDNNIQAWDVNGQSIWTNGEQGNYYSDYTGPDKNHDAIGDTNYTLYQNSNNDTHPLYCPFNPWGPSIRITRPTHLPTQGHLYLRNLRLRQHDATILLGTTKITVCAVNYIWPNDIVNVTFSVDGIIRHTDSRAPYTWNWNLHSHLRHAHNLSVTVTDNYGDTASDTIQVKKFF